MQRFTNTHMGECTGDQYNPAGKKNLDSLIGTVLSILLFFFLFLFLGKCSSNSKGGKCCKYTQRS